MNARSNQSILYAYLVDEILGKYLKANGCWSAPDPAPLTADEVEEVFEGIAKHYRYRRQRLMTPTCDNYLVKMENGVISRERFVI